MAFKRNLLKSVSSLGEGTLWSYKSADTVSSVTTSGYMDSAADVLNIGDAVYITEVTGLGTSSETYVDATECRVTALTPSVVLA